ncbi:hypothetical protein CKM354_000898700 [Cercospora kikuchii]|uniref:BTB domain-containing protein n=1 Tax=Cercospora kikuchii TaxID=84275 RepID=A0A9P3CNG0_9PEZI|nr:uncharacterized protein CKM354_000898700 [Cercospora kikuchii]GIZ45836.1 hypothetical protein CKM354_000898700 [Cercospora kikuchii]
MSDIGSSFQAIDPEGDVILVVGELDDQFQVSSAVLSKASPVFQAMLGPNFREGQQLRSNGNTEPVEIPLPDDDPKAMTLMCRLLHCRDAPAEDERLVDNFKMLPAALAFDKYQVVGPLHWQIRGVLSHWLFDFDAIVDSVTVCAGTVAAAYLLNCDDAYNRATAHLINICEDSVTELVERQDITDIIPLQVLLILEERRVRMQTKMSVVEGSSDEVAKDGGLCLRCSKAGKQDRNEKCVGRHGAS